MIRATPTMARLALAMLTATMLFGCGGEPPAGEPGSAPSTGGPAASDPAPRGARTLPIPGSPGGAGEAATGRASGLLRWDIPAGWTAEPPNSPMRYAQYAIPGAEGDAQCVVYYFGPGQGGDPMSNAMRWAGQFVQPDGSDSRERMQVETIDGTPYPTRLVSVRGTYNGGLTMTDQPSPEQPGAMLLGGMAEGPDAPWFFKLTGPESTVAAQRDAMIEVLRSLRPADG